MVCEVVESRFVKVNFLFDDLIKSIKCLLQFNVGLVDRLLSPSSMQSATSTPTVAHGKLGDPGIHWTQLASLWARTTLDSTNLVFPMDFTHLVSIFVEALSDQDSVYFPSVTRQLIVASAQMLEIQSLSKPARCLVRKTAIVARDRAIALLFLVNEEIVDEERRRRVNTWLNLEEYNLDEFLKHKIISSLHNAIYQRGIKECDNTCNSSADIKTCSSEIKTCSKKRGKKNKKKKLSAVMSLDASIDDIEQYIDAYATRINVQEQTLTRLQERMAESHAELLVPKELASKHSSRRFEKTPEMKRQ